MAPHLPWAMLALAWSIYFGFSLTASALFPLATPLRESLGLSYGQVGMVFGAWQLVYVIASLPVGRFVDRRGTRTSLLVGIGIIFLSGLLRSIATDFVTLLLAVSLFGVGGPIVSIGLPKVIAGWFSGSQRGTAAGIYVTGSHAGAVAALALTNSLVLPAAGSWRGVLQVYAAVVAVIGLAWWRFGRETPGHLAERQAGAPPTSIGSYSRIIRLDGVWPVMIIGWSGFLSNHGLRSWLPELLMERGFDPSTAGIVAALPAVAGMVGSIVIVRHAAARYRWYVIMGLLVSIAASTALVATTYGEVLVGAIVLQGFCAAALMPLMLNVLMDMPSIGPAYVGAAGGLYFAIGEIGGFVGPSAIGVIVEWTRSFEVGVLGLAITTLLMLVPAARLRTRQLFPEAPSRGTTA